MRVGRAIQTKCAWKPQAHTHSSPATSISSAMHTRKPAYSCNVVDLTCIYACRLLQRNACTVHYIQANECTIHNGICTMHAFLYPAAKGRISKQDTWSWLAAHASMQPFSADSRWRWIVQRVAHHAYAYIHATLLRYGPLICVCKVRKIHSDTLHIIINIPGIEVPQENSSVQSNSLNTNLTSFCSDMIWYTKHLVCSLLAGRLCQALLANLYYYRSRAVELLKYYEDPSQKGALFIRVLARWQNTFAQITSSALNARQNHAAF